MTRLANARLAGFTFLFYIAAGIASIVLSRRARGGALIADRLANIAAHPTEMGVLVVLGFFQAFSALILAVTLYAITRDQDRDLSLLGMLCRSAEGIIGAASIPGSMALLWLATSSGPDRMDTGAAHVLAAYLFRGDVALTATFFAVGSTAFAWLFFRGRLIPLPLAWLGIAASVLLVVCLPLQLAGFLRGPILSLMWLPMLAFEVPLALWLLIKGVAPARAV
jgi:hypothetical protein